MDGVATGRDGQQHLGCADVGCGPLPPDVLLAGLQGEPESSHAVGVPAHSDHASGKLAFEPGADGVWSVDVPEVAAGRWYFEQLWIDGRRATRARSPNRFFHPVLEVVEERLEAGGEVAAAQDAHAAYILGVVDRFHPYLAAAPEQPDWTATRTEIGEANFRAALTRLGATGRAEASLHLAIAVAGTWEARVAPHEGRTWLEWGLANSPETDSVARGHALAGLAQMHWLQGQYAQAMRLADASLAIAERLAAFGADPAEIEAGIRPDDDSYSEPWIPDEDLPARDPELARVFEAFDADEARYEAGESGWWDEMEKDMEEGEANGDAWSEGE